MTAEERALLVAVAVGVHAVARSLMLKVSAGGTNGLELSDAQQAIERAIAPLVRKP